MIFIILLLYANIVLVTCYIFMPHLIIFYNAIHTIEVFPMQRQRLVEKWNITCLHPVVVDHKGKVQLILAEGNLADAFPVYLHWDFP